MTLIDLGEVGFTPPAEPDPPPTPRWLRRLGVPARRQATVAAAVAVIAGALAGTAPAADSRPAYRTVPAIDLEGSLQWASDGVVVQLTRDSLALSATDLGLGEVLWSARWDKPIAFVNRVRGADVLVQTDPQPWTDTGSLIDQEAYLRHLAAGTVSAVDLRTGQRHWQVPGAVVSQSDAPELFVLRPAPAEPAGWQIVQVDAADGHELWSRPAPSGQKWAFTIDDKYHPVRGGLVLMDSNDGSVQSIGTDGSATPRGRVAPGGTIEWAWSDYIGVSYTVGGVNAMGVPVSTRFELHDLRTLTARPLWTTIVDPMIGASPWPCGVPDRVCISEGNVRKELRVRDGAFIGLHEDEWSDFDGPPHIMGVWSVVGGGQQPDRWLAAVGPALSKTGVGWLGSVRVRDGETVITPVTPVPVQIVSCWSPDESWIVCGGVQADGTRWNRSLVLRWSDVDEAEAAAAR